MESDKRYFIEGLFVIGLSIAMTFFYLWLERPSNKDDVLYRIHFAQSVAGLSTGDPVKFLGVDVGTVETMSVHADDPGRVQVDVKLRKDAPVKTDTKATLKFKGIAGAFFIELDGGSADARSLVEATPAGQVPEIVSQKSELDTIIEQLPKVVTKFSAIEDQTKKVVTDIGQVTNKVKQDPSLLLRGPKKSDK
jgi:phospholipid/cholesterol/gamma-HCH transport system substrate-binding protein